MPVTKLKNGNFLVMGGPPHGGREIIFLNGKKTNDSYLVIQKDVESMPFKELSNQAKEIKEIFQTRDANLLSIKEAEGRQLESIGAFAAPGDSLSQANVVNLESSFNIRRAFNRCKCSFVKCSVNEK